MVPIQHACEANAEDRRTRWPTEAEIAEISARHFVATPIKPADLLFVFGTREDVAQRADEASRLGREGLFRWAIVSGGVTPGATLSECEIIKTAMVERGIPPDRILEEHRAMNTGENVIFSLPVLEAALGLARHTDPEFRTRVLWEWDKIEPYKARGFIAEWPESEPRDRQSVFE